MNGHCSTCPVEEDCGYAYKPCDCCNQRKFKPKVTGSYRFDVEFTGYTTIQVTASSSEEAEEMVLTEFYEKYQSAVKNLSSKSTKLLLLDAPGYVPWRSAG
jgi:hypothetical protein